MKSLIIGVLISLSVNCYSQLISDYSKYVGLPAKTILNDLFKDIPKDAVETKESKDLSYLSNNVQNQTYFKRTFTFPNITHNCSIIALYYKSDLIDVVTSNMNTFYTKETSTIWRDSKTNTHYEILKSSEYFILQISK